MKDSFKKIYSSTCNERFAFGAKISASWSHTHTHTNKNVKMSMIDTKGVLFGRKGPQFATSQEKGKKTFQITIFRQ
jgi:hypothetical protein